MLSQLNPQSPAVIFKLKSVGTVPWVSVELGIESIDSAQPTRRTRATRELERALGRWIVIVRPTFARNGALSISCPPSDQNPTVGLRRPPLAFAHARGRHGVSRGVGSASSRHLQAGQRLPLRAFNARRAPLPKVVVSPAPVAQLAQRKAGTEAHP